MVRIVSALMLLLNVFVGLDGLFVGEAHTATAAASSKKESRFGMVADVGTRLSAERSPKKLVALLAGSGAGWVKEEFRWDAVQPSRDRWTWDLLDAAVNAERAQGLEILGLLDFSAGWAVGERGEWSAKPPPHDLWANYVARTVERYKDRVHAWEVWNEPNVSGLLVGEQRRVRRAPERDL